MWGAIIQAIDRAKERLQESAGAGIKVADSQHGGGAPISNMDSGAGEAASSILSDENAKTSKPVSNLQSMRAYGANVGKGFANAGAIATGNKKAAEREDIDNSVAKKAAEDIVKGWRKRDFNKQENASTAEEE